MFSALERNNYIGPHVDIWEAASGWGAFQRLVQTPCLEFVHSWLCYKLKDSPNKKHTHKEENNKKKRKGFRRPQPPNKNTHKEESNKNKHGKSLDVGRSISFWLAIHSSPVAGRLVLCCRRHSRRHRPTSPSAKCFVFFLRFVFCLCCRVFFVSFTVWVGKVILTRCNWDVTEWHQVGQLHICNIRNPFKMKVLIRTCNWSI